MFSSPSRGGAARRRYGGDGVAGSVRSSRASTPSAAPARRRESRYGGGTHRDLTATSFLGGGGDDESVLSVDSMRTERRNEKSRSGGLEEGTVLSRDDNHAVTVFSRLPTEASAALSAATPYDALQSSVDPVTGFAHIITRDKCFIWDFNPRRHETPTCFVYNLPASSATANVSSETLVQCSLVPKGADREPGILFIYANGTVRYGDHVSNALSSDRSQETAVALGAGETVVRLHRCHATLLIAATSQARLIAIRLVAAGGQLKPVATLFTQPRGLFGRFFGATATTLTASSAGIVGLVSHALPSEGGGSRAYDVYALTQQSVQKWSLAEGRGERLAYEDDVRARLVAQDDRIDEDSHAADSVMLVDAAVTKEGTLTVLYSYELADNGALHYGIASLTDGATSEAPPRIKSTSAVQYMRMADSRPYSQPRLLLPQGGPVLFIVFTEAVVFRMVNSGGLEENIELRDVASNRIIGVGAEAYDGTSVDHVARLSVVTQRTGALLVEVDAAAASQLSELIETGEERNVVDTHRLKSKLERGVFHSDNVHNPISFDLPLDVRGDLTAAAEQLSDDIVRSESPSLVATLNIKTQLANRLERLHSLAAFLSLNGMLGSVSQNCLRKLCADAQLVAAAIDLWAYVDELLSTPIRLQKAGNLLDVAVQQELSGNSQVDGSDVLRHFFRYELRSLNGVLVRVRALAEQSASGGIERQSFVQCEANRIVLTTFQAALRYRTETSELYRLDATKIAFEAWTCTADDVRLLRESASVTSALVQERSRQLGNAIDQAPLELSLLDASNLDDFQRHIQTTLKGQLCELAAHTLDAYEERLAYLRLAGASHASLERECALLKAEYAQERRNVLLPLVKIGRTDRAFYLAEHHSDFETLTELCSTLPKAQQATRIRAYLNRYSEPFAASLFTFYVQTGQMHVLLTQDDAFHDLLKGFLDADPALNRVAWLHDLATSDYKSASQRLVAEAAYETQSTASMRLMLSLSKLCHVSRLSEKEIATQEGQSAIEVVDDQLDLLNVHDRIRKSLAAGVDGGTDDEEDDDEASAAMRQHKLHDADFARLAAEEATSVLALSKPANAALYAHLVQRLFAGRVVSSEDLVDLLTLRDANENSAADFSLAVEVFVRGKDMPPTRARATLCALWRRAILFDDWATLTQTTDASEAVLAARLSSTVLYSTLQSASGNQATSEVILPPAQTLVVPPVEAFRARLQAAADEELERLVEVDGLVQEAQDEVAAVQALLTDVDLGAWYVELGRLLMHAQNDDGDATRATQSRNGSVSMEM